MNLKDAFDGLLSENNEIRQQADLFLSDQIMNNPLFYNNLFEIYKTTDVQRYKRLSLIMLRYIITQNFRVIMQIFQEFCGQFYDLILNSSDNYTFRFLADIIYLILFQLRGIMPPNTIFEYFYEYLIMYRTQNNTIPFCIHLYSLLMQNREYYLNKIESLVEIVSEIILSGLQCDDIEMKLYSIDIFSKIAQNIDDNFIDKYQDHISIINQIAENSLEINEVNENYFYKLWLSLFKFDNKLSDPLFETAHTILHSENLSPKNRNILLDFIIVRNELISADFIEDLITSYFSTRCEIEDVDDKVSVFNNLIKVDDKRSYELFKREIFSCLKNDNWKKQYVGLSLLPDFFITYPKETVNDISKILRIAVDAATKSEENLSKCLDFFDKFLSKNKFNLTDSMLIFEFLINTIVECTDDIIQYKILDVFKSLTVNPLFFEKMINIFQYIQPKFYPIYFSILICLYRTESPINMDKYQPFLTKLIEIFNEYNQKVAEIKPILQEDLDNFEIKEVLYSHTLIQGSASNLIFYLRFFSPTQLEEHFNLAIENIFNILDDEFELKDISIELDALDFSDEKKDFFSLADIVEDFTIIVLTVNELAIEIIKDHIDIISDCMYADQLQHFLCSCLGPENRCGLELIQFFNEEIDNIFSGKSRTRGTIFSTLVDVVYPMSKWIYKITDNPELHKKFMRFISMLTRPDIASFDIYNLISEILLRFVKPKRVEYNKQNTVYEKVIKLSQILAMKMIDFIVEVDFVSLIRYFDGFTNIVLLFAYTKNDSGHKFLSQFLVPFYVDNQEITETKMLDLFSKLINLKYCNDDEIEIIVEIVIEIIVRGKFYQDIETSLLDLMTNLIKIHPEISPLFIDFSIEIFNENKNDESQTDLNAYCAHFLLSAFNRKPEEFEEKIMPLISEIFSVFPISEKPKTEQFWFEIKSFIKTFKDKMTEEIRESLMRCLTRYLSYQEFTNTIFSVPDELHGEIIQVYGEIIGAYLSEHPDITLKDILDNFLPHQPASVEYILSLYSKE